MNPMSIEAMLIGGNETIWQENQKHSWRLWIIPILHAQFSVPKFFNTPQFYTIDGH